MKNTVLLSLLSNVILNGGGKPGLAPSSGTEKYPPLNIQAAQRGMPPATRDISRRHRWAEKAGEDCRFRVRAALQQ